MFPVTIGSAEPAATSGGLHDDARFGASQRRKRPAPTMPRKSNSRQITSPRSTVITGQPVILAPS